ncbi:MAG: preprotein translocase subunit SecA [Gammaproteobacteria bacterium]|nr:preprotein translocase subunit SecA [Gammaproteobacteria bacterium]
MSNTLKKVFGSRNQRLVKRMMKIVRGINALEAGLKELSDDELRARTVIFRERLALGETPDQLLEEAFAVVREASVRTLGLRHFDVQLVGGIVLHEGKIAEMRTGEGKTLVATLAAYLNSLGGQGVHLVTVNDYLARRDAIWMGPIYHFLGLSVGIIQSSGAAGPENASFQFDPEAESEVAPTVRTVSRKEAYACDITYGTNNEYGFDYLRDNMAFRAEERVQRARNFAIVDEVDSILIDEARTPLIISGPAEQGTELYTRINSIVPSLTQQAEEEGPGDFWVDEKDKVVFLTDEGHEHAEHLLTDTGLLKEGTSLYDITNISLLHHLNAALRAHNLFEREVDYIVKENEVIIVDEFTGRMMPGRRWSDGLHQAIEAKEGVRVREENQTLASITFQNFFRLYDKLSGMTGTADTEAYEFQQIYGLEVVVIPTDKDMVRNDMGDLVYRTQREKFEAILEDVRDCHQRGQPVLVGTASIEASELISQWLQKNKVAHEVLNAKQHEREAQIIAQAGRPGAVTIATNMAGRGTDIVLGGNLEKELAESDAEGAAVEELRSEWRGRHEAVIGSGGLHVIGTERHESRRIDNQLRGRSGRQGDPGSSRFYLSLEDNLMRIFGSERLSGMMERLGMEEGEAIEHPWVTRAIEKAQRKVEGRNFDIRKQLLEYDDVANDQRKVVYEERNRLMELEEIADNIRQLREEVLEETINSFIPPQSLEEQWNVEGLAETLDRDYGLSLPLSSWLKDETDLHEEALRDRLREAMGKAYADKESHVGEEVMRHLEKAVMLQVLDTHWKEHLANMDHLRQGIGLRGYAQKNPKQEYKLEAFEAFSQMLDRIKRDVVAILARVQIREEEDLHALGGPDTEQMQYQHPDINSESAQGEAGAVAPPQETPQTFVRKGPKVGRNDPCPCGSGKKYKQCHGKLG